MSLRVEGQQLATRDQFLAQRTELVLGPVAPVHAIRLGLSRNLRHPVADRGADLAEG